MTKLPPQLKVFLCHASQDKTYVRGLYTRLSSEGFAPWLDDECILPGQDWDAEIRKALRSADAVLVCLSQQAVEKTGYVQKEIKLALDLADEQPEGQIFLIPAHIEDCQIPERLSHLQSPQIYTDAGYQAMLEALRIRTTALGQKEKRSEGVTTAPAPIIRDENASVTHADNFKKAFAEIYWEQFPNVSFKKRGVFTVSLVGDLQKGKTSLLYVLTGAAFNFLQIGAGLPTSQPTESQPYVYRLPFRDNTYITDHPAYTLGNPAWQRTLDYLQSQADLVFFVVTAELLSAGDHRALTDVAQLNATPVALVANKIDNVLRGQLSESLEHLRTTAKHIPLPVSVARNTNLDLLTRFIEKARQQYS